jgi:hypothetical protein
MVARNAKSSGHARGQDRPSGDRAPAAESPRRRRIDCADAAPPAAPETAAPETAARHGAGRTVPPAEAGGRPGGHGYRARRA